MIKVEALVPLLNEALEKGQDFKMPVRGTSMLPCICDKDYVVLTKPESLKKNDVIFYVRENGQYVLHRIYQVKKDYYVLMGDNQCFKEYPIYPNQVLAKVKEVVINGEKVDNLTSFRYKLFLFFWHSRIIRKIFFPLTRRYRR